MHHNHLHERTNRPPHWLPLPGSSLAKTSSHQNIDEQDHFSKGEVVGYFPRQGFGFVRTHRGEDLYFCKVEADLVGQKKDWKYLKVGMKVGFDVAWTSKGLHVTKIKIY
ncbi:MAG: hypothetical protein A3I05_05530 [Deltaproteobacteria bacterium RIFCSPLOWO2_02_FULL_44_10]|nr:MAG: hypothetical protein A3C46_06280 [Deltaproteobacteria bacterium RIFCSPHIGHO2_02_FULL_44_16]OGQ46045.1 MAG: hypothetical protein A3I05_05530 [Deltaproteobacteria bacterium RIFCSPLOWO2_02_FULL_44_10]